MPGLDQVAFDTPSWGFARRAVTATTTIVAADRGYTVDCTSGTYDVALTAAATLGAGFSFGVYNSGSGTITINPNGAETIRSPAGSAATHALSQGQGVLVLCDGTGFEVVASAGTPVGWITGVLPAANGGTGVANTGTITNASNTTVTGGGTLALGGFTLTAPASGTAALLATANIFSAAQTVSIAGNSAAPSGGLTMTDPANTNKRLVSGVNNAADQYFLQAAEAGVDYKALSLNPNGGAIIIGADPGGAHRLRLGGTARVNGSLTLSNAGSGLLVQEGSNATMGQSTMVGGTVTVATTAVTATSRIFLTSNVDGGTVGFVRVSARVAGTSFTITSSSGLDTSQIAWLLVEPAP